jgi:lipopolysaccharide transport system ATP-binding protein
MPTAISIENVTKSYRLGVIGSGTLREDLQSWWHRTRGLPDPNLRVDQVHKAVEGHTLWALQDVSLEIQQGEVWGIIGRNGAGKSTLLKILSRVTAPTSGRIRVKGRVASLLEVGTGFHPELTGRENIFLNGAILGMTKAEVAKKFDEIVDFSEIEAFIDTPVKRYSSGMYVRLAFAVAAHLEPEILVVDEVLAVGDAAFQKKCLGKMGAVAGEGRTVLFVSHYMPSILALCTKGLWIKDGKNFMEGESRDVVNAYLSSVQASGGVLVGAETVHRKGTGMVQIQRIEAFAGPGKIRAGLATGEPVCLCFAYRAKNPPMKVNFEVIWSNGKGERCMHFNSHRIGQTLTLDAAEGEITCQMDKCPLMPGDYTLRTKLYDFGGALLDEVVDAAVVSVATGDYYGTGRLPAPDMCSVLVDHSFGVIPKDTH